MRLVCRVRRNGKRPCAQVGAVIGGRLVISCLRSGPRHSPFATEPTVDARWPPPGNPRRQSGRVLGCARAESPPAGRTTPVTGGLARTPFRWHRRTHNKRRNTMTNDTQHPNDNRPAATVRDGATQGHACGGTRARLRPLVQRGPDPQLQDRGRLAGHELHAVGRPAAGRVPDAPGLRGTVRAAPRGRQGRRRREPWLRAAGVQARFPPRVQEGPPRRVPGSHRPHRRAARRRHRPVEAPAEARRRRRAAPQPAQRQGVPRDQRLPAWR